MAKCKECGNDFTQFKSTQKVCSPKCAIEFGKKQESKKKLKEVRKWQREEQEKLKTVSDYIQDFQRVFNTFIRERDVGKKCITCSTILGKVKYDAGHYYSAGGHPSIRFDERNVHGQCVNCNRDKHGNLILYNQTILERISNEDLEELRRLSNTTRKYTIIELKDLIKEYRQKLKKVKELRECK